MYPPKPLQREYKEGDVLVTNERTIIITKIKTNRVRFTEIDTTDDSNHSGHNYTVEGFNIEFNDMLLFRHGKLR